MPIYTIPMIDKILREQILRWHRGIDEGRLGMIRGAQLRIDHLLEKRYQLMRERDQR